MTAPARSRSTDRRFYGVVEGVVVANSDTEAKEGRVKVKFPWFDDTMVTEWCRVSQLYAGNGYGSLFVPEQGDEVLVAFVHGDMRFPIIIGGLYNGADKPPSHRDGSTKDQKIIRTKGKHEILLDDSQNAIKIRITTPGGHELLLDDQAGKIDLRTPGGATVELDDQGQKIDIHTAAGAKVVLEDQGSTISVQVGSQSITLEPSGIAVQATKVTVSAPEVTVESPQVTLGASAGAMSLVLGDAFMAVFNAHTHVSNVPSLPTSPPVPPLTPAMLTKLTKAV